MNSKAEADYLFEASWEVCNKVGGIYTVIVSKAGLINERYKNYIAIGPYFEKNAKIDFEEKKPPKFLQKPFEELKKMGVICHFGNWLINPKISTILIDSEGMKDKGNELKTFYWEKYQIDSLFAGWDFEEPLIWATAVGYLLENVEKELKGKKIVAHFHEWLAGFSLLYLKDKGSNVKTVFTTHATMLGRALASGGMDIYAQLNSINPEEEAKKIGILDKFTTEKACATKTDILTTVSEITAMEVEHFLGRKPEVLLLNGLDSGKFPTYEEAAIMHRDNREEMREFTKYFFFPYYIFDIKETYFFCILGRYEFKNKGIDILIKALAKLNERLKKEKSKKTFITFFFIPKEVKQVNPEISENKVTYRQIKDLISGHRKEIEDDILEHFLLDQNHAHVEEEDLSLDFVRELKRLKTKFKKDGNAPLSTHIVSDENNDEILNNFKQAGLLNKKDDPIKVIDYPIYLTGVDGLLDLTYYETITGCHLGLFPSYYEPWGYTPLEAAALGVAALATDVGGFGRFILSKKITEGVYVLKRLGKTNDEIIKSFTDMLYKFVMLSKSKRVDQKLAAKKVSTLADWKILIENYVTAHNLALKK